MATFDESNIMSDFDVESLFTDDTTEVQEPPKESPNNNDNDTTEDESLDLEKLFDSPESVGSDENNKEQKDTTSEKSLSSPSVLSSLAKALKEDGIFLDLADEDIEKVKDADSFKEVIEKQLKSQFDERQKRVDEALNNGIEPDVIKRFENTLSQLNSITEEQLKDESAQSEQLRKYLLKQDFLNRNYSAEQADRMVNRTIAAGTDIEDAIEALNSIKNNVKAQYDNALEDAKKREEDIVKQRNEDATALRKGILERKDFFGDLQIANSVRQKALDNVIKPIWKDPETGDTYTALQKYERDNHVEFLQNVGLLFTLTDGFKNLDNLIGGKVNKAINKGFQELETKLSNTQRNNDGSLNFASGVDDENSFLSGFTLDI